MDARLATPPSAPKYDWGILSWNRPRPRRANLKLSGLRSHGLTALVRDEAGTFPRTRLFAASRETGEHLRGLPLPDFISYVTPPGGTTVVPLRPSIVRRLKSDKKQNHPERYLSYRFHISAVETSSNLETHFGRR
jgi:hypothetical protein